METANRWRRWREETMGSEHSKRSSHNMPTYKVNTVNGEILNKCTEQKQEERASARKHVS